MAPEIMNNKICHQLEHVLPDTLKKIVKNCS